MSSTLNHQKNIDFLRYRCGRPSRIINLSYAIVVLPASRGRTRSVSRRYSGSPRKKAGTIVALHYCYAQIRCTVGPVVLHYRRVICTNPMHRRCLPSILSLGLDCGGKEGPGGCLSRLLSTDRECVCSTLPFPGWLIGLCERGYRTF